MATMSNGKLERLAVEAVNKHANLPGSYLIPEIPVGDKGISFDGKIIVLENDSEKAESWVGEVPVQVKGTEVETFTEGSRTFSLEIKHYRNFYKRGTGALLLVVEINKLGDSKVFYKQLLPYELREIITIFGDKKKQNKKAVELRPLSETNLYRVCFLFLKESKKQSPYLIENSPFTKEDFDSFVFNSLTYNPAIKQTSNIFDHSFMLYGKKGKMNVPLHKMTIEAINGTIEETIQVGKSIYSCKVKLTTFEDRTIFLIDNTLRLSIPNDLSNINTKILNFTSIAVQKKILPLYLGIIKGEQIDFKNIGATFQAEMKSREYLLRELENALDITQELEGIFNTLNIDIISQLGDEDTDFSFTLVNIERFIKMVNENDFGIIKGEMPNNPSFFALKFMGFDFIFHYDPFSEKMLKNPFSKDFITKNPTIEVDGKMYPYSPYILVNEYGLAFGTNVDLQVIEQSFNQINPFLDDLIFITNNFCLRCINAFDLCGDYELLELANSIYQKHSKYNDIDDPLIFINTLQIRYRYNEKVDERDINKLMEFKSKNPSNNEALFCANVLLDNKEDSKFYFNKLGITIQENYKNLPIYTLYQKLVQE